jgi:hypothetical protein
VDCWTADEEGLRALRISPAADEIKVAGIERYKCQVIIIIISLSSPSPEKANICGVNLWFAKMQRGLIGNLFQSRRKGICWRFNLELARYEEALSIQSG